MDTSSDDGSKNEPVMESLTNWSLSSFVKPDPKPIEKAAQHSMASKRELIGEVPNSSNKNETSIKSYISPKCLSNDKNNLENHGKSFI